MIAVYMDTSPSHTCDQVECDSLALFVLETQACGQSLTVNTCLAHVHAGVAAIQTQATRLAATAILN